MGELHPVLLRAYGIERRVAFVELEVNVCAPLMGKGRVYQAPLPYPVVKRDIAFIVSKEVEYQELCEALGKVDHLIGRVELFDTYEGHEIGLGNISMAFHLDYVSSERTLTIEEADKAHGKVVKMLEQKFGAKIRV